MWGFLTHRSPLLPHLCCTDGNNWLQELPSNLGTPPFSVSFPSRISFHFPFCCADRTDWSQGLTEIRIPEWPTSSLSFPPSVGPVGRIDCRSWLNYGCLSDISSVTLDFFPTVAPPIFFCHPFGPIGRIDRNKWLRYGYLSSLHAVFWASFSPLISFLSPFRCSGRKNWSQRLTDIWRYGYLSNVPFEAHGFFSITCLPSLFLLIILVYIHCIIDYYSKKWSCTIELEWRV